jgi:hypothetical protein
MLCTRAILGLSSNRLNSRSLTSTKADCRRIDRAAGVVPARPRGGFRLSLRDVKQCSRILGGNE